MQARTGMWTIASLLVVSLLHLLCTSALGDAINVGEVAPRARLLWQAVVCEPPRHVWVDEGICSREIQRGYEALVFWVGADGDSAPVLCDTARRRLIQLLEVPKRFRRREGRPAQNSPLRAKWPEHDRWNRHFCEQLHDGDPWHEKLIDLGMMQEGFDVFVSEGGKNSAHLFVQRSGCAGREDIGKVSDYGTTPLGPILALHVLPSGQVAVLGMAGEKTVLQLYENPVIDILAAQLLLSLRRSHGAGPPPLVVRTVGSLYSFAEHADRGFDSMCVASDGSVYFGTMPHHPEKGSPIFRYDPAGDRLEELVDLDAVTRDRSVNAIPNMMHAEPVEMDGVIYFTGQDPFYGRYAFPGPQTVLRRHAGSPLVAYDMATGTFESLGVPLPGEVSIFRVVPDPQRRRLYLRQGYWPKDWRWVVLQIDERGKAGAPEDVPLTGQAASLHLRKDGTIFYSVARSPGEGRKGLTGMPHDVFRYNPDTGGQERIASIDAVLLGGLDALDKELDSACEWLSGQQGASVLYGLVRDVGALICLDTTSGTIRTVCRMFPDGHPGLEGNHTACFAGGTAYCFTSDRASSSFSTSRLVTVDVKTGAVRSTGPLVDKRGRFIRTITQVAVGRNGRVYLGGTVYGGVTEDTYMQRGRRAMPAKIDSGFFVLDPLALP